MRPYFLTAAVLSLGLTACAPVTEEASSDAVPAVQTAEDGTAVSLGRIRDEADFVSLVAGRELVGKNDRLTVNADGTYSGTEAGVPVSGTWDWRRPVWCATPAGESRTCFAWDRIPNGIRRIREQGMGGGVDFAIR